MPSLLGKSPSPVEVPPVGVHSGGPTIRNPTWLGCPSAMTWKPCRKHQIKLFVPPQSWTDSHRSWFDCQLLSTVLQSKFGTVWAGDVTGPVQCVRARNGWASANHPRVSARHTSPRRRGLALISRTRQSARDFSNSDHFHCTCTAKWMLFIAVDPSPDKHFQVLEPYSQLTHHCVSSRLDGKTARCLLVMTKSSHHDSCNLPT
ncbi:uncharacterized protein BO95DRAFT_158076 [Aspergillus brunneoviolaceus CBS 621.78]|uniref:Uncharacterized protein n=1 Tax=Aspergillus brunneoviolaceus CBS 621.78 TaxID=1450534 RepID=A0ACD1GMQ6_9EURO|nr:hypothetical protein BO95DRAFT_158076 [Aspergillus brunneoviolaceus CBS 621.78]RAH50610.1 hypothetical protein BO95DRAFT_158076 [Aspergillus brunneoviolaceus CBS 621.78]